MDGQNFQNGQNVQAGQNEQAGQNGVAQDSYGTNYYTSTNYYTATDGYQNDVFAGGNNMYMNSRPTTQPKQDTPGLSIAGLVLGIISVVFICCSLGGIVFGVIGLILSILGNKENRTGVGTAGIVCSAVGLGFSSLLFLWSLFDELKEILLLMMQEMP
ncbi:MAG: hypothetical protein NC079_07380 [Clostridium sp.]|nr:hypothetical protein [Acetatifactor muris]MCM1527102.1 hypothetical protein [Bacteroides sp.]MCM1563417.1 hypothetical protein [Clostridium sp.]